MFSFNVELDEDLVLNELKSCFNVRDLLEKIGIDEDSILDEFYFSEILDRAISRDEDDVVEDLKNSSVSYLFDEKPELQDLLLESIKRSLFDTIGIINKTFNKAEANAIAKLKMEASEEQQKLVVFDLEKAFDNIVERRSNEYLLDLISEHFEPKGYTVLWKEKV